MIDHHSNDPRSCCRAAERSSSAKVLASLVLILICGCLPAPSVFNATFAQQKTTGAATALVVGQPIERKLTDEEEHLYTVELKAGQYVEVSLRSQGILTSMIMRRSNRSEER